MAETPPHRGRPAARWAWSSWTCDPGSVTVARRGYLLGLGSGPNVSPSGRNFWPPVPRCGRRP